MADCCCAVQPYAQVTMTVPPPILAPTQPSYVKPLQLPCPMPNNPPPMSDEEAFRIRYSNFYNNYNLNYKVDYRNCPPAKPRYNQKTQGCEDYTKNELKQQNRNDQGCPTGFLPCQMELNPMNPCDPCAPWIAGVHPCPPKRKPKRSNIYIPGPCTRPCCKHWKPKTGSCKYDKPCIAHCFDHPPGIKPSGRSC